MKTLTLQEAALFLKMSAESLRLKTASGEIPGAKPGRRWCFREDDLAEYLRSLYPMQAKTSRGVVTTNRRTTTWHSANEVKFGGLESVMEEREYNTALEPATK
ncbi:MAG: helix-turn-helix domain-containing protein [Gammaproteobacteria bacterium]|nr:helix-turn-helix domain-containing protein [Gammaproteobacteria bacterium]